MKLIVIADIIYIVSLFYFTMTLSCVQENISKYPNSNIERVII